MRDGSTNRIESGYFFQRVLSSGQKEQSLFPFSKS